MVNRGRSGGCVTCKRRRVKCDETKPECRPCRRLELRCGGYTTKPASLKFRDQNYKFRAPAVQDRAAASRLRHLAEPDTAVPFFLGQYASIGRDMESARGFYEILVPVYCSQQQDSALSLAVSALASKVLSLWRHGSFQSSRKYYTQAIARLRSAIQDRTERSKPATVLAVLALQLYENIAAIYGLRSPTGIHHNGAVSLLPFADSGDINGMISAYIRRFVLHTEISSAMRQERALQDVAHSWIGSRDLTAAPDNPSSALDAIGASVAELQASYRQQLSTEDNCCTASSQQVLGEYVAEAKRIDEELLAWAQSVPDHWQPRRLTSGRDVDSSMPTYRSVCEVYPSCQIANIWNLWRIQRLLLVKVTLGSLDKMLYSSQSELTKDQISAGIRDFVQCKQTLQEMVDAVCYSVPFYLGNRSRSSSITDFTDPTILVPGYPSPAPGNERHPSQKTYDPGTPSDEYKRHVIAQGPWHVMSPLSRLLTLFSEDHVQPLASFLRPGQHEWIRQQFLRVTVLLHLPPPEPESTDSKEGCCFLSSEVRGSMDVKVEYLARGVRKGAVLMSGP
ncbi:hypothetical protein CONLIGDRAFT_492657 [Coniochaeta ligniaria NRRL 30616]|uniref:Zn(2)-C6 fungal-type domain-containing protein n=1 Tax=Coniochaeta ligniaria NRRL 30616 TaxID=1408157 RepID=A0A1J7II18_9PEZI|nr:hypothetical protein CONLIGDRAFT_492657 [Coniochaeta ligniaria NRRL 30616]